MVVVLAEKIWNAECQSIVLLTAPLLIRREVALVNCLLVTPSGRPC